MFGRSQEWKPNEIPVAVCATADDVRRAVRRKAVRVPIVRFQPPTPPAPAPKPHERDWLRISSGRPIDVRTIIPIHEIIKTVSDHCKVSVEVLQSEIRTAAVVRPRQIAMYLCREYTLASLPTIGRKFGGRDHTTVLASARKITILKEINPEIAKTIADLKLRLGVLG